MKEIFYIALTGFQVIALVGLLAVTPALYRREVRKQEEKA